MVPLSVAKITNFGDNISNTTACSDKLTNCWDEFEVVNGSTFTIALDFTTVTLHLQLYWTLQQFDSFLTTCVLVSPDPRLKD